MTTIAIQYWNDCDLDASHYSTGFKRTVILKGVYDTPLVVPTEEVVNDGQGVEFIKRRSVESKCVIEVCDIMDAQLMAMYSIRSHSNIVLFDQKTQTSFELEQFDFTHTPDAANCHNIGRITFVQGRLITNGCCDEDETFVAV